MPLMAEPLPRRVKPGSHQGQFNQVPQKGTQVPERIQRMGEKGQEGQGECRRA
jgi:hypothetical protein